MTSQRRRRSTNGLSNIAAMTASTVLLFVAWKAVLGGKRFADYDWFTFHPTLMTVGLTATTYAIMNVQPPSHKSEGIARHQLAILAIAFPAVMIGVTAIYYKKEAFSAEHITTWHATVGFTTAIYMVLQVAFGTALVWPKNITRSGGATARSMRKYHRLSGYTLITLLLVTVHLGGAWSSWSLSKTSFPVRLIAYVVAPLVLLIAVSYNSTPN